MLDKGMPATPSETVQRAWARLIKAQRSALGRVERALKSAGLPPLAWYDALLELERVGARGLRPFELERAMLLEQYNLSRLLDRLEKAGYVERRACADDGRGNVVVITASGKAMRRRMWPAYAAAIEDAFGRHLSEQQAKNLDALLGALIARPHST
ncbi:MAG: winged helix-turn-helix transcriptional regulator [Hyphomicrobiales bacterium]|nr:winged helix-turn-helix transcriptional regulator [Hyphomicrobiales bacterium]MBV8827461.1 winged helix-turn-helix transcriptional regulator [Hyphomicrobiales bacterium]